METERDTVPIKKFLYGSETRIELMRNVMFGKLDRISNDTEEADETRLEQFLFERTDNDFIVSRGGLYVTVTRTRREGLPEGHHSYKLGCQPEIYEERDFTLVNDQFKHTGTNMVCSNWSCSNAPTTFSVFTNKPDGSPRASLILSVPRCENVLCRRLISTQSIRFLRQLLDKNSVVYSCIERIITSLSLLLPTLYNYSRNVALTFDENAQSSSLIFL